MSKLKYNREKLNLTQEELAAKSGVSVRTIQRIEAGTEPKGYTLKTLAKALNVDTDALTNITVTTPTVEPSVNYLLLKLINLSSIFGVAFPPINIVLPLCIMFLKKEFSPMAKQLVSVQILWTILAVIIFMLSAFMKNWFALGNKFTLIIIVLLVLSNIAIILTNAMAIDKKKALSIKLNFNFF